MIGGVGPRPGVIVRHEVPEGEAGIHGRDVEVDVVLRASGDGNTELIRDGVTWNEVRVQPII